MDVDNEESAAIEATRGTIRELVDGTIRLTVDIDPINKTNFHKRFPDINMRIAIVPMLEPHQIEQAEGESPPEYVERISKWAAMCCQHIDFQQYVAFKRTTDATEQRAIEYIYDYCNIVSRRELDVHGSQASKLFRQLHAKFTKWVENRG